MRARFQLRREDHFVDESDAKRVFAGHGLAAQHHVQRAAHADEARQSLRASRTRKGADPALREPERDAGCGKPEVAAERELEPSSERHAVENGNRHEPGTRDGVDGSADRGVVRKARGEVHALAFLEVGAGAERATAAAQQHDPGALLGSVGHRLLQCGARRNAQRVHALGTLQPDFEYAVADRLQGNFFAHWDPLVALGTKSRERSAGVRASYPRRAGTRAALPQRSRM